MGNCHIKFELGHLKDLQQLQLSLILDPMAFIRKSTVIILRIISALATTALNIIERLVHLMLQAIKLAIQSFRTLLTTPINIPVLSDLYEKLAGQPLSIADLMALLVALPATISYKLATNNFTRETLINVRYLLDINKITTALGVTPPLRNRIVSSGVTSSEKTGLTFYALLNMLSTGGYGLITAGLEFFDVANVTGFEISTNQQRGVSITSAAFGLVAWGTSCPMAYPGVYESFDKHRSQDFNNIYWLSSLTWPLFDVLSHFTGRRLKLSLNGDSGAGLSILLGILCFPLIGELINRQKQEGVYDVKAAVSNILVIMPNIFKFLRLSEIEKLDKKLAAAAHIILAVINTGCYISAAAVSFVNNLQAIDKIQLLAANSELVTDSSFHSRQVTPSVASAPILFNTRAVQNSASSTSGELSHNIPADEVKICIESAPDQRQVVDTIVTAHMLLCPRSPRRLDIGISSSSSSGSHIREVDLVAHRTVDVQNQVAGVIDAQATCDDSDKMPCAILPANK